MYTKFENFLIQEKKQQLKKQLAQRLGSAIHIQMRSKDKTLGLSGFLPSGNWVLILEFTCSIRDLRTFRLEVSSGSMAFSSSLKRAREPKRPSDDIVDVKVDAISLPLVICSLRNFPVELEYFILAQRFFPKTTLHPPGVTKGVKPTDRE